MSGPLSGAVPGIVLRALRLTHGSHVALRHLHGRFAPGSLTAVVGPNGAGKTTLLRALAGLHRPESGGIEGLPPGAAALLPQAATLDRTFPISCLEVVELGAWGRAGAFRRLSRAQRAAARAALARVGLAGLESRPIGSLSGGQLQRVLFARLLLQDAPVLLLDEPFAAVDERTVSDLLGILRDWHVEGRTVIAVLHDLDLVRRCFPETLLLAREGVAWGPTEAVLSAHNRARVRALSEGWGAEAAEALPGPAVRSAA